MKNIIKPALLLTTSMFLSISSKAQLEVYTGGGILLSLNTKRYVNVVRPNVDTTVYSYNTEALAFNAVFYPKYHLKQAPTRKGEEAKPYSISVGAPIALALQFFNGGTSFNYGICPAVDINLGSCNPNNKSARIGFFAGLGAGVQNTNNLSMSSLTQVTLPPSNKYRYIDANNFSAEIVKRAGLNIGPMVHLGLQLGWWGFRAAYQPAINRQGINYITLNAQRAIL